MHAEPREECYNEPEEKPYLRRNLMIFIACSDKCDFKISLATTKMCKMVCLPLSFLTLSLLVGLSNCKGSSMFQATEDSVSVSI